MPYAQPSRATAVDLLRQGPFDWLGMYLVYFVLCGLLMVVPLVGLLAYMAVAPALVAGMVFAAAELDAGRKIEVPQVFKGFTEPGVTGPLLKVGLVMVLVLLLAVLLVVGIIYGGSKLAGDVFGGGEPSQAMLSAIGLATMAAMLIIGLLCTMALFFGIPRVLFSGKAPLRALAESLKTCITGRAAWIHFGAAYCLGMATLGLYLRAEYLLAGPLLFPALYAIPSYVRFRDHYGLPAGGNEA